MAARKSFLIRLPPELLDAMRSWAEQEMRSANGQIEWVLRDALRRHGRLPKRDAEPRTQPTDEDDESTD